MNATIKNQNLLEGNNLNVIRFDAYNSFANVNFKNIIGVVSLSEKQIKVEYFFCHKNVNFVNQVKSEIERERKRKIERVKE